jgi:hypothetical protein
MLSSKLRSQEPRERLEIPFYSSEKMMTHSYVGVLCSSSNVRVVTGDRLRRPASAKYSWPWSYHIIQEKGLKGPNVSSLPATRQHILILTYHQPPAPTSLDVIVILTHDVVRRVADGIYKDEDS